MNCLTALMATITVGVSPSEGMSRQQLVQLMDAAQSANCRDATFDYEGKEFVPGKPDAQGIPLNYSGTFKRRADGAIWVDIYSFDNVSGNASRCGVAILNQKTESSMQRADQKNASVEIKEQGILEFAGPGNFRQIWLSDLAKKLAESPYQYQYEGIRSIDDTECIVVRFRLVLDDSTPLNKTVSYIFWIDLNRGGHVLRFEQRFWGENLASLTTVRLARFERGPGFAAWLPVSGRVEVRLTSKNNEPVFLDKPARYETYDLLPVTLQFDQGLKDDAFSVKAKVGDAVSDEVRKARYEFGQYMMRPRPAGKRVTDTEIKAEMDRMLQDSSVMAGELKASSPLRDGPGWLSSWPWMLAVLALLGASFLYYKSRRR